VRITDDASALAYLADNDAMPAAKLDAGRFTFPDACGRCGGKGKGGWYPDGGTCYECEGRDTSKRTRTEPVLSYARKYKAKLATIAREARKATQERTGALAGLAALGLPVEALACKHRIARDIVARFERWGSMSQPQANLLAKLWAEEKNPKPQEAHVAAPIADKRQRISGRVVSCKWQESDYGGAYKMTVKMETPEGSWLAWGTVPAALETLARERRQSLRADFEAKWDEKWDEEKAIARDAESMALPSNEADVIKGATVALDAMLKPGKDAHFAILSRPTKPEVLSWI
jgi:uncharacterized membrane protein